MGTDNFENQASTPKLKILNEKEVFIDGKNYKIKNARLVFDVTIGWGRELGIAVNNNQRVIYFTVKKNKVYETNTSNFYDDSNLEEGIQTYRGEKLSNNIQIKGNSIVFTGKIEEKKATPEKTEKETKEELTKRLVEIAKEREKEAKLNRFYKLEDTGLFSYTSSLNDNKYRKKIIDKVILGKSLKDMKKEVIEDINEGATLNDVIDIYYKYLTYDDIVKASNGKIEELIIFIESQF